jgi:rod shape-determining protein MreC
MRLAWKIKKIWLWLFIIAFIFFAHFSRLSRPLENSLTIAIRPLGKSLHGLSTWFQGRPNDANSIEEIVAKLTVAENKLVLAIVDQAQLQLLVEENNKLRQQLNFLNNNNHYRLVSANIVSRQNLFDAEGNAQDIILDRGSKDGIITGLGVINESGVIIGKIIEVKDNSSRACLTTGNNCQLAAAILNGTKTIGLSEGELGLTIKMNYIPQMEQIKEGDIVISSGLGDNIPRGLVIGRVAQVNNQSNEIWQDVSIEPIASLYNLTVVAVVLP